MNITNDCLNCFQLSSYDNSCQEVQFHLEGSKSLPPKFCQLTWKNMMFHYFGFHYVTCSQPLDMPCACGTFKKPMSSIGSVGYLVETYNTIICQFPCMLLNWHSGLKRFTKLNFATQVITLRLYINNFFNLS